ncbi:MAG TPA: MFS transporter [Firmicutes bacterium]|jgi:MFS transporter, DHA3 family, macrolide efflux protein|nr:MFS transporter [Bacillota bacterium]
MNHLFLNRNFFLLWTGRLVSQIGDKFYGIALAWWVLQKTHSPLTMGFLMVTSALPGLLMAPWAGACIDRLDRKPIMVAADIIRSGFVLTITILSLSNRMEVWHVFVVGGIISLGSVFYDPTVQAVVPQIVRKEQLAKANSYSQMISGMSTVLGPIFGALSVSLFSYPAVFFFNSLTYLVSAFCGWRMVMPARSSAAVKTQQVNKKTWNDIRAGMLFLMGEKSLLIVIAVIGLTHFFFGGLLVLLPFLANGLGGKGVRNLGYLETMMGLGLIVGSLFTGFKKKAILGDGYLFLFMLILGIANFCIGVLKGLHINTLAPYLFVMIVVGTGVANASIYWQSILQVKTPSAMMGRIFSISVMMGNLSLPLAYGLFGLWLKSYSLTVIMGVSGIALGILSIALFIRYQKARMNESVSS